MRHHLGKLASVDAAHPPDFRRNQGQISLLPCARRAPARVGSVRSNFHDVPIFTLRRRQSVDVPTIDVLAVGLARHQQARGHFAPGAQAAPETYRLDTMLEST